MGLASRLLLLPTDGTLLRLSEADFARLCRGTDASTAPVLADQRVKWASLVVELVNRQPICVVHRTFAFLHFDGSGRLDVDRMNREQVARLDATLSPVLSPVAAAGVLNASSRFTARGGAWKPDHELQQRLDAAALGQLRCPRLKLAD